MVNPYGFQNEINPVKNTYELTIPETLVPIENHIGHLHSRSGLLFLKKRGRAARAHYIEDLLWRHWSVTSATLWVGGGRLPHTGHVGAFTQRDTLRRFSH